MKFKAVFYTTAKWERESQRLRGDLDVTPLCASILDQTHYPYFSTQLPTLPNKCFRLHVHIHQDLGLLKLLATCLLNFNFTTCGLASLHFGGQRGINSLYSVFLLWRCPHLVKNSFRSRTRWFVSVSAITAFSVFCQILMKHLNLEQSSLKVAMLNVRVKATSVVGLWII